MSEIVPEGWLTVQLNDISKFRRGTTYISSELSEDRLSFPLYINMKSFKVGGGYSVSGDKFYTPEYKQDQRVEKNDLLIANTDVTSSCDILGAPLNIPEKKLGKDILFSHHVTALRLSENVNKLFLFYLLCLGNYRIKMQSYGRGTTVKMLDSKEFGGLYLNLPPLPEQKKIASILTSVDKVIETTQKQIDKLQDLKKATMNELLTKGIDHTEFKDSELGRIPKSWEFNQFDMILNIIAGKGFELREYSESGVRLLRIDNVSWGEILWDSCAYLPNDYLEREKKLVLKEGDLLLALNRPITQGKLKIAKCGSSDVPSILYQRVGKISSKDEGKCSNDFAFYLLQQYLPEFIKGESVGSDQPFINLTSLRSLVLPIPDRLEQLKVVKLLKSIDTKNYNLTQKLTKTQSLKKSLMQDLLTGKVRVKVN